MARRPSAAAALRALLSEPGLVLAPSIFDGLSLRAVERNGFQMAHVSGSAGAGSYLGLPDIGLVSMSEVADHVRRLAQAAKIGLIVDGDNGYGGTAHVHRFIELLESAGAAGVHIEDQTFPKRCGFLPGREIVSGAEFEERIGAAVAARQDPDFVVIARTDALDLVGVDEAVDRGNRSLAIGADAVLVEAITTLAELEEVGARINGPKMLVMVGAITQVDVSPKVLEELGFKLLIYPGLLVDAASRAMDETLAELAKSGSEFHPTRYLGPVGLARSMGIEEWLPGVFDETPGH